MSKKAIKLNAKYKNVRWGGTLDNKGINLLLGDATQTQLKKILATDPNAAKYIEGDVSESDKDDGADILDKAPKD